MKKNITQTGLQRILLIAFLLSSITTIFAQAVPVFEWAKAITGDGRGNSIAIDASGNVFTTGYFSGTADFDPGAGTFNLTSAGLDDIFISKLDASGNFVWAKRLGGTGPDWGHSIAIDASGNVLTTGRFSGTVDFDPGAGTLNLTSAGAGTYDGFISKLDASGNFVWAKQLGGTNEDISYSIAIDASDNVFTTGQFFGTSDFDPGTGTFNLTSAGLANGFISKLDASGNFVWAKQLGGSDNFGLSIAIDVTGNVLTTGAFSGMGDFDPGIGTLNLTSAGSYDIFISKLDASGNLVWVNQLGGAGYDQGRSINTDEGGNVLTTGAFSGIGDFDPGTGTFNLTSAGNTDIFVSKVSDSGNFVWAKQAGGAGEDVSYSIVVDALGNVFATGFFRATVDFDPGAGTSNLTSAGGEDIFIANLNSSGNFVWAIQLGGTDNERSHSIAINASNNLFTTGLFRATVDFDPGACTNNLVSAGAEDIFVQKLSIGTAASPTITSFSPPSGPIGTSVTITGTNFSTTPANNVVKFFNNQTATVTASTATSITTTVPAGAITGKISATVNCVTVQSATDFTVSQDFITQWNLALGALPTQLSFGTATSGPVAYAWQQLPTGLSGSGAWSGATLTITGLPSGATIRLQIAPTNFQRIHINSGTDRVKLTQVEQWGSTAWTSMENAFYGCDNLQVTATDVPNLSGVTNMFQMFAGCPVLNSPSNINTWNTGTVTNMQQMFFNASAFNQNIGAWNTSAVASMQFMFHQASAFNQNIGAWNTGAVTDMSHMFRGASAFNQNIGAWNTGAVTNMSGMFLSAIAFNQNIGSWNTSAVTNMSRMFESASAFNQSIGAWDTGVVTDMSTMFYAASAFNQNIGSWNTSAVADMTSMFSLATAFNQNIGAWDTGAVTSMRDMFNEASGFNQNIGTWNTSAVTEMFSMFFRASAFNQNIGAWNTGAVTRMARMFYQASAFNQDIGTWNTGAVTDMGAMFYQASAFNQNIGGWNTAAVNSMIDMFKGASAFNQNIGAWNLSPVVFLNAMFDNSGMDCSNYSATLMGWSANPSTPNGRQLGAIGRQYGTNAVAARTNLTVTKGWTITGDTPSGTVCGSVTVPTITSFTPASGPIGTTVTITGTNFSTTLASNIVYFGATRAAVTAATSTQLTVTVPVGATHQPISVQTNGLTGNSLKPFVVTFAGGGTFDNCSFEPKVNFETNDGLSSNAFFGDIDGDGKVDVITAKRNINSISIYRNTSIPGQITSSSFAPKIDIITGTSGSANPGPLAISFGDIDGDGKPDIAAVNYRGGTLAVFRNLSTSGTISLSSRVDFAIGDFGTGGSLRDIDGDGKLDAVITSFFDGVSVLRNTATSGIIDASSFASRLNFATGPNPYHASIADFDSDGKLDIAVPNANNYSVSLLHNTSTSGTVSFAPQQVVTYAGGTPALGTGTYPLSAADLDGDGKIDLLVSNNTLSIAPIFRNTSIPGTITFAPQVNLTTSAPPAYASISDLDGDGKIDLAIYNGPNNPILIYKNSNVPGTISTSSFDTPIGFGADPLVGVFGSADIDGDGKNDIVNVANGFYVLRNVIGEISPPTITSFTPSSGPVGTTVTITGTNFSTPFANTVEFNGMPATITASTATSLTVTVPAGATTGPIQVIVGCNAVNSSTNFSVCTTPSAPGSVPNSRCGSGTVILGATGTTDGNYRWYTVSSGGTAIAGEVNSSYTTPIITSTTTYYVSIDNGGCEGPRTPVTATINIIAKPAVTSSNCTATGATLTGPTGFASYAWSDGSTTPSINVTLPGSYTLIVTSAAGCMSPSSDPTTFTSAFCNQPPTISPSTVTTTIQAVVTLSLNTLISDLDNNIDLASVNVAVPPTSGATATVNAGLELVVDYSGVAFAGTDQLTIEACDLSDACTQQQIMIEVAGDITIFNAISPNGDGKNDVFYIQYINALPETQQNKVTILNRWGTVVFETANYDNTTNAFKGLSDSGSELPSGTYYYTIEFTSGEAKRTGFLSLRR